MDRWPAALGAVYGFLAVALGAFGAHALKESLDGASLDVYRTAAAYQLAHAVLLVALGSLPVPGNRTRQASAYFVAAGVLIFCGSLYALAVTGVRAWGAVAPVGGSCLLLGWGLLAWSFLARREVSTSA